MQEERQIIRDNLEICPNCLEPNEKDLANCAYCGMPLRKQAETAGEIISSESTEKPDSDESAKPNSPKAPAEEKKPKRGMANVMRGMGIYLIFYAVTEIPRSLQKGDPQERMLAIVSDIIYMVAGVMMAWPLFKDYQKKRKEKKEKESAELIDSQTPDNIGEETVHSSEIIDGTFKDNLNNAQEQADDSKALEYEKEAVSQRDDHPSD
jgi:hypothetical protein